ncbi:MAG: type VI secretion system tube protein Hcp [Patescibacteria group bacterium]
MKNVIHLLRIFIVLAVVIGWTAAGAQTLSGTSIIFGTPSSSPFHSSSVDDSAAVASDAVGSLRSDAFPVGVSLRLIDFPAVNQSVDIPLQSYGMTVERQGNAPGANPRSFSIVMRENLASPRLFLAAATGDRLPSAIVSVRTRQSPQELLRWTLSGVTVLSYASVSAAGDDIPLDTLTLNFERIEFQVTPLLPNGTTGSAVKSGWDSVRRREL